MKIKKNRKRKVEISIYFSFLLFLLSAFPAWAQKVTWTCSTCSPTSGTATGAANWTIPAGVGLAPGPNTFNVTATDLDGATGSDSQTLTLVTGTIAITAPVTGPRYITTNAAQPLSGTASCSTGTPKVTWANDKGGSGNATGTTTWTIPSTGPLTPGVINTITVTNTCPGGPTTVPLQIAYTAAALIAAYSFDENAGTAPQDATANNNHGSFGAGAAYTSTAQKYGASAIDFSGGSVTIPASTTLNQMVGAFTLSAWVNPDAVPVGGATQAIINHNANAEKFLWASSDGSTAGCSAVSPIGGFRDTNNVEHVVCATTPLQITAYSCVALTYDGADFKLWVNKAEVASTPMAYQFPRAGADTLQIGNGFGTPLPINGKIDEVRIYNGARSLAEISTDCDTNIGVGVPTAPTGLKIGSVGVKVGNQPLGVGF